MKKMKAAILVDGHRVVLDERPIPEPGPNDALVRITLTTICGSDIHIMKGEVPIPLGRIMGHEPVGVIEKLGKGVRGYKEGQRVICGSCTPSGWSNACLCGCSSMDGTGTKSGFQVAGGWRLGNTDEGTQAEYFIVPDAMANLAVIPDHLTDEQVLMCPDIMSTGFAGAESGKVQIGDTVAIFAQGPIGLCSTAGAKLMGATTIIAIDSVPERLAMAKKLGADIVIDFKKEDPYEAIMRHTDGRGVDVAIEALGTNATFEAGLRSLRPGGCLSSLGIYSSDLKFSSEAFGSGLANKTITSTMNPGGKERMRRMMDVVASGRVDLSSFVTHRYKLDQIEEAYDLFANQRDGVLKIAITP